MNNKSIFEGMNLTEDEKIINLESLTDDVEELQFDRAFSLDELNQKRESIADQMILIDDSEEELKAQLEAIRNEVKKKRIQLKSTLRQLKVKSETVTEKCYKIADQETRIMTYYDKYGFTVLQRPLKPSELQLYISKAAVNE